MTNLSNKFEVTKKISKETQNVEIGIVWVVEGHPVSLVTLSLRSTYDFLVNCNKNFATIILYIV